MSRKKYIIQLDLCDIVKFTKEDKNLVSIFDEFILSTINTFNNINIIFNFKSDSTDDDLIFTDLYKTFLHKIDYKITHSYKDFPFTPWFNFTSNTNHLSDDQYKFKMTYRDLESFINGLYNIFSTIKAYDNSNNNYNETDENNNSGNNRKQKFYRKKRVKRTDMEVKRKI